MQRFPYLAWCNTIKHSNENDCAILPDDYHRVCCGKSVGSVWDSLSDEDESAGGAKASLAAVFTEENKSEFSNSVASYKLCLNTSLQTGKPFKFSYIFFVLVSKKTYIQKREVMCNFPENRLPRAFLLFFFFFVCIAVKKTAFTCNTATRWTGGWIALYNVHRPLTNKTFVVRCIQRTYPQSSFFFLLSCTPMFCHFFFSPHDFLSVMAAVLAAPPTVKKNHVHFFAHLTWYNNPPPYPV